MPKSKKPLPAQWVTVVPIVLLVGGLAGCASYHPLPLDDHAKRPQAVTDIRIDTSKLAFPRLRAHHFDPTDGLDMTEVAMLAVVNNPDLKLARDDVGVGRAQSFAARLLPDPQLSLSRDYPQSSPVGTTSAFNASVAYDLNALISHGASVSAASAEERKTDLNLLWQEWQVVSQARVLFSQVVSQSRQLDWLTQTRNLLDERYRQSKLALNAGEVTADSANVTLIAWQDAARQVNDLERQREKARQDLNVLLGLAPSTRLELKVDDALQFPDETAVHIALAELPSRRPDLLALKAGYAAEDARYRQAILAQFPPLNLALTQARDTAGLFTQGFTLATALPLLNGNRGNIRIEEATRQRLHDDYEQRLNAARNEVDRLLMDNRLIELQLKTAAVALPSLEKAAENARRALSDGDLDGPSYIASQSAWIAKQVEVGNLRQSLLEGRIALLTLLGGEFANSADTSEKKP